MPSSGPSKSFRISRETRVWMERGFKTRCEEMARSLRAELGLDATAPLRPGHLAAYLGVAVWSVADLGLDENDLRQLVVVDPDAWSAITVSASNREAIVVNPNHRGGRYSSDVMHELAHLLLGHQPSTMFFAAEGDMALRGYDSSAEEEANWLAAALLLPRDVLVWARRRRVSSQETCEHYGVSKQMLAFRTGVTGIDRQFKTRKTRAGFSQ